MRELTLVEIGYLGLNPFAVQLLGESYTKSSQGLPMVPTVFRNSGIAFGLASSEQALHDHLSACLDSSPGLTAICCERDRARSHLEYTKGQLEGIVEFSKGRSASAVIGSVKKVLETLMAGPYATRCWCGKCKLDSEATP